MRRAEETKEDEKSDRWKEEGEKKQQQQQKKRVHKVGASGRCKVAGKATVGGGGQRGRSDLTGFLRDQDREQVPAVLQNPGGGPGGGFGC